MEGNSVQLLPSEVFSRRNGRRPSIWRTSGAGLLDLGPKLGLGRDGLVELDRGGLVLALGLCDERLGEQALDLTRKVLDATHLGDVDELRLAGDFVVSGHH